MGAVGGTELERFLEELAEVHSDLLRAVPTGPPRNWANYSTPRPVILSPCRVG